MRQNINLAACMCVRNCGDFLPRVFANLDRLSERYQLRCIIVYDNCTDSSPQLIKQYQASRGYEVHAEEIDNPSDRRTVRIAKARNRCLEILYGMFGGADYHIMLDADSVNTHKWNMQVLDRYLNNIDEDNWDAISFNRPHYYDIWALAFDQFQYNCWGFGEHSEQVVQHIKQCITNKLKQASQHSIEVQSAFNGFAIHKTRKFENILYDGYYKSIEPLINHEDTLKLLNYLRTTISESIQLKRRWEVPYCEHVYYYRTAAQQNGCIIKVSKFCV